MKTKKSDLKKKQKKCHFCEEKTSPDYKEVEVLKKFVSERGKIISKKYTGTCAKHQRQLVREIKRARHLALLPFVSGLY